MSWLKTLSTMLTFSVLMFVCFVNGYWIIPADDQLQRIQTDEIHDMALPSERMKRYIRFGRSAGKSFTKPYKRILFREDYPDIPRQPTEFIRFG
ncbi:hypothetical protein EG68_01877 [Paragonimus skrjabini miyazakii]|uniref:Uncharacterized protein n=1 Tax=Paragonimus skrjabini miyazakii TaxID=59628 RepID=A0A8S9Z2J9_9TREM|nr:hypothetical protein EG68_01877 [Paragonimus skrjabini miyazakii]